jgi:hypothetical protein
MGRVQGLQMQYASSRFTDPPHRLESRRDLQLRLYAFLFCILLVLLCLLGAFQRAQKHQQYHCRYAWQRCRVYRLAIS